MLNCIFVQKFVAEIQGWLPMPAELSRVMEQGQCLSTAVTMDFTMIHIADLSTGPVKRILVGPDLVNHVA